MNNYHRHSHYSTVMTPDSAIKNEDYAKRAVELGDKILSSLEHGFQGNYFECYDLAKEYGLKFIYGAEAYWVKNRFEQDRTNGHICLFAKTNKGRKSINLALAEANENGYYYKPRIDIELILNLPPNDVFVTSACLAFWHYEDIEEIVLRFHNHFKSNFMLEVQANTSDIQKNVNRKIIELSKKHGIEIILGQDSHFIYPEQAGDRQEILNSRDIHYDDESDEWYMDYPTTDEIIKRMVSQDVLTIEEINRAIENTKIFETFDDFDDIDIFSQRIKLPSLYKNYSQEEKDMLLKKIIWDEWKEARKEIPEERHSHYIEEIAKEYNIVKNTKMSDYFLLDYELVKQAIKRGGQITNSGRGSGVSMYLNTLLGFSKIDRVSAPVKMFPERFMAESRILQSGSLPDLDLNLGNPEVFAEVQKELLGEFNSYPMIAYDYYKTKASWKMYAKAKNVDFEISNKISQYIDDYETELKYADDDEKDLIVIEDFIPEEYLDIYRQSEVYHGIISGKKAHPCGYLIYEFDIREEIGIIRAVSESTGKSTIVCLLDGLSAEKFKFLKNDLLKVDVVNLMNKISDRINQKVPTEKELIEICEKDESIWDIYKNGWTIGVNQVEKESTTKKAMRYAPKNIADLCAFIAAIRPSFMSMYSKFEKREDFKYGIPTFDKIIRDTGVSASWILYQETIMAVLGFAGFEQDKTYDIIKAISKKRKDKIDSIKPKFVQNFKHEIIKNDGMSEEEASKSAEMVWQVIENSSQYGFNASHSYSYAYDSLLCAYYKAKYPIYFYEVLMQTYSEKGNKRKVQLLRKEMKNAFGITVKNVKLGDDNRNFVANEKNNEINMKMSSIKKIGESVGENFYKIKDVKFNTITDCFYYLSTNGIANKSQILILIQLGYFDCFGSINKNIKMHEYFYTNDIFKKSTAKLKSLPFDEAIISKYATKKTDAQYSGVDFISVLREIESTLPNIPDDVKDLIPYHLEYLGAVELIDGTDKRRTVITDLKRTEYNTQLDLYCLATGETKRFKLKKKDYRDEFDIGSILYIKSFEETHKLTPKRDENGEIIRNSKGRPIGYDKLDETELVLLSYIIED